MPTLAFPKRHTHADVRSRAYLTAAEVDHRRNTARRVGRHGLRHATMLLASRHGLRVSALMALRWDQLDSDHGCFHGRRLERGGPSTHLFTAGERRALRRLKRAAPDTASVWGPKRTGMDAGLRWPTRSRIRG